MIGANLEHCILHIVRGTVKIEDVETIYTGLDMTNPEKHIPIFREYIWSDGDVNPDECEKVMYELLKSGRVCSVGQENYGPGISRVRPRPIPLWYKTFLEFRNRQAELGNDLFLKLLANAQANNG